MRRAIDVANYTAIPTPAQVAQLRAMGYERAIVGCSYPKDNPVCVDQLKAFLNGGMEIEAYAWVSFSDGWQELLNRALLRIDGLPVKRLWLDCEEELPVGMFPDEAVTRIAQAFAYVQHIRTSLLLGVYTGGWWWKPNTADNTGFRNYPLWTAEYTAGPPVMYGGWLEEAMWQTAGSVTIAGLNADDNVILEAAPVPKEEDMTPFNVWDLDRQRVYLVGPFGAVWVPVQADADALAAKYGKVEMALHQATIDAFNA